MNDQHNENGPDRRGNDDTGPGQPPTREAVIVTDESIQPTTDSAPIAFGPLEPYREPGYEAVRALIHRWGRDAYENSRIWRAVEAFGDAMQVPSVADASTNDRYDEGWERGARDAIQWLHEATDRSSLRTYESGHEIADELARHVLGEDI